MTAKRLREWVFWSAVLALWAGALIACFWDNVLRVG